MVKINVRFALNYLNFIIARAYLRHNSDGVYFIYVIRVVRNTIICRATSKTSVKSSGNIFEIVGVETANANGRVRFIGGGKFGKLVRRNGFCVRFRGVELGVTTHKILLPIVPTAVDRFVDLEWNICPVSRIRTRLYESPLRNGPWTTTRTCLPSI